MSVARCVVCAVPNELLSVCWPVRVRVVVVELHDDDRVVLTSSAGCLGVVK